MLPDWKKPAAKGPWYQVESKPVMPVPSRSFTPLTKWPMAMPAISSEMTVASNDGRRSRGDDSASDSGPSPTTHLSPSPTTATATRYGTGLNADTVPRISATQIRRAIAATAEARNPASPPSSGSSRRRTRAAPSQAKPTSQISSAAPSRYRPGPSI